VRSSSAKSNQIEGRATDWPERRQAIWQAADVLLIGLMMLSHFAVDLISGELTGQERLSSPSIWTLGAIVVLGTSGLIVLFHAVFLRVKRQSREAQRVSRHLQEVFTCALETSPLNPNRGEDSTNA